MNLEDAERPVEPAARVVEFRLGEEVCAVDIDAVDSIVEPKHVTRVPRAPAAVEGVMDLRGETTAVVDPREYLSVDGDAAADNILVLDRADDKQKIGLRVGEVTEVASHPDDQVDTGEDLDRIGTAAIDRELVRGVVRKHVDEEGERDDVDLVLWVDVDALVDAVAADRSDDNQR